MPAPDTRPWLSWVLARHAALGGVTEIRALRHEGPHSLVWSGCFGPEHLDALVAALRPVTGRPRGSIPRGDHPRNGEAAFYFSLQAVQPEAAADRMGALRPSRTTTRDADILAYTLFVVDVDPVRKAGSSATDAENAAALDVARAVRAWFAERGVDSLLADSGNGWHLLVPLVPRIGEDMARAAQDAHDLLALLDARFSTPAATVDVATFNPSRILKLYGTRAVKGAPTPVRPHRDSSVDLAAIPPDVDLFDRLADDLAAFRETRKKPTAPPPSPSARPSVGARPDWTAWRAEALARLPLDRVYGDLLTGQAVGAGWLQCRDPGSPSGDRHPSAGVADGTGEAERGAFHSFRTSETMSVFDFLVSVGRAPGFRAACDVVADLASVPIPTPARPALDEAAVVEDLRRAWATLPDQRGRLAALRRAIATLLGLRAAERDVAFQELRAIACMTAKVFEATVAEVRKEAKAGAVEEKVPPSPRPDSVLPTVDFVVNMDPVAGFFDRLLAAVAPHHRFFRAEREMVYVRPEEGPLVLNERNVSGCLLSLIEIRYFHATEEGLRFLRFGVLPSELARAFVSDPRTRSRLPRLRFYTRSPVFDERYRFIGMPGYDAQAQVYYDGPTVRPAEGVARLTEALSGFHWKGEADLVNFAGALLTTITMPAWGRGHPFLVVNGKKPGVGKSTLAAVLAVVAEGNVPSTVSFIPDEAELEKQLATRVDAASLPWGGGTGGRGDIAPTSSSSTTPSTRAPSTARS